MFNASLENPVSYALSPAQAFALGDLISFAAPGSPAVAFPPVVALPAPLRTISLELPAPLVGTSDTPTYAALWTPGPGVKTWDYTTQLSNSEFITSIGVGYDLTYGPKFIGSVGAMSYVEIVGGARPTPSGVAVGCAASGLCQGALLNDTWVAPVGQALIAIRTAWGPVSWSIPGGLGGGDSTLLSIMFVSAALGDISHSNPSYSKWYGPTPGPVGAVETYYAYQHFITGFAFRVSDGPPSWQAMGVGALTALRFSALPFIMSGEPPARKLAYCNGTQTDDAFSAAGYSNSATAPYNSYNSLCVTAGAAYCATALGDPACVPFCKVYDCTAIGQAYTRDRLAAWQAANPSGLILSADGADDTFLSAYPECACFLDSKFYTNYFNSMNKMFKGMNTVADIPACAFTPCATSDRKPLNVTCPANQSCTTIANVTNKGTINGDFSAPVGSSCLLRSDVSSADAPLPPPPAAPPASSRYALVVIIFVLLLVAALAAANKKRARRAPAPAAASPTPGRPIAA